MLTDAFAAEQLRFLKARWTLFWSFLFVPIIAVLAGTVLNLIQRAVLANAAARGNGNEDLLRAPTMILHQVLESVSGSNFFLVQVFFLIAASSIFGGDYRWETWRLLTPRNTRTNLILAKLGVFGAGTVAGLVLLAVGGVISAFIAGGLVGGGVQWAREGDETVKLLGGVFAVSWLEMMVVGALAAVIAVLTRSGVASLLVPVGVWIVQAFALSQITPRFDDQFAPPLAWHIGIPALAADHFKATLEPAKPGFTPPTDGLLSMGILAAWIVGLTLLAVWLFKRQDLTRE